MTFKLIEYCMPSDQHYYKQNRLQQLRGFYYTVQTGSPSKAAELLCLGKSAITMQLQTLERDVKSSLFIRERGNFKLTESGERLFNMAAPLVQSFENLYESFIKESEKIESKQVNIAAHHIAISYLLPQFIKKFKDKHPDVQINIRNLSPQDSIDRLQDEKIDMAIYPYYNAPAGMKFKPSFKYEPLLIMSKNHPLSSKTPDTIKLEEIAKYDLVRIDPKLIVLPLFEEVVKEYNIGSNIAFENGTWEMLKHFVAHDIGLALVSTICFDEKEDRNIKGISLKSFFPNMNYGIMVKQGGFINESAREFITLMDPEYFDN